MAARALKAECSFIPDFPPAECILPQRHYRGRVPAVSQVARRAVSSEQRVLPCLPDLCVSGPVRILSGSEGRGNRTATQPEASNPERWNPLSEGSPRRALPMTPRRVELGVSHWSFIEEQLL